MNLRNVRECVSYDRHSLIIGESMKKDKKQSSTTKVTVAKGVSVPKGKLSDIWEKPGSSNAGKYKNVKPSSFAGASGGASKFSFPIDSISRARSALARAHFAPDPEGIRRAVYRKYPQLKKQKGK